MKITTEVIKQRIMLLEQKLELYRSKTKCSIVESVKSKLEKDLDQLYDDLKVQAEIDINGE